MRPPFDFAEREPETRMITSITGGGIERPGSTLGSFLQVFGMADVTLPASAMRAPCRFRRCPRRFRS
jgi:hypothetical protein